MPHFTFLYSTRMGTYFHLTPYHIKQLGLSTALLSLGDFVHMQEVFQKVPSFKEYIGLDETTLTCLTCLDPYKDKCVESTHLRNMLKIQQLHGWSLLSLDNYHR
jgi:queuine tRNA-ribosyltransferase subunit QTRTD1